MALSTMDCSALTQTDLHLIRMHGHIEEMDGVVIARNPDNPGRYWSNFLLLPRAPQASELEPRVQQARRGFAGMDGNKHVMLRWDGDPLDDEAQSQAKRLGLRWDGGLEMRATELLGRRSESVQVRPMDLNSDWDSILRLNQLCDPTEGSGDPRYDAFKTAVRRDWKAWKKTRWWGAFVGDRLVGQCGMVVCPDARGRFQSVETHPEYRRRGVCSTLIATVGQQALKQEGCREVLLGADLEGPARALYERLGFQPGTQLNGLLMGGSALAFRAEQSGDIAEIRSITDAAFESSHEGRVIDALRGKEGVISMVATQSSSIQAHALFSPVHGISKSGELRTAIALGPISVRPSQQRRGIGSDLIRRGLARCVEAGWSAVFVLGNPHFYGRFGWKPASTWGLHCKWPVDDGIFQALELKPGALDSWKGRVDYSSIFDTI